MENNTAAGHKRKIIVISVSLLCTLLLCAGIIALLEGVGGSDTKYEQIAPVDPSKLAQTKEKGFDIMEYDEYLALDRTVYLENKNTGVTVSVDDDTYKDYGDSFEVIYTLLQAIKCGDADTYNELMGDKILEKESFTQQQIYDITVELYSEESKSEGGIAYDEVIYKVRYKIHENNGTYRDNIVSDVSRPQYFVMNDRSGEFEVIEIIEKK